jgi:RNA polymerase sigma-70 factor (ECF subfamily)
MASEFERVEKTSEIRAQPSFEELFTTHKDRVYSIALHYAGDPAAALDISQQVFLKLMAKMTAFRGESSFDSWLYRIVVNCCLDYKRRNWRWLPFVEESIERWQSDQSNGPAESTLDHLVQAEVEERVQKAIAVLAPDLRIVVVLRYTETMSYEDISRVLRIPPGTVASRLNRAHKILERRLAALGPHNAAETK